MLTYVKTQGYKEPEILRSHSELITERRRLLGGKELDMNTAPELMRAALNDIETAASRAEALFNVARETGTETLQVLKDYAQALGETAQETGELRTAISRALSLRSAPPVAGG